MRRMMGTDVCRALSASVCLFAVVQRLWRKENGRFFLLHPVFLPSEGVQLFVFHMQLVWDVIAVAGTWSFGELNLGWLCFNNFLWRGPAWEALDGLWISRFLTKMSQHVHESPRGNNWKWSSLIYVKLDIDLLKGDNQQRPCLFSSAVA